MTDQNSPHLHRIYLEKEGELIGEPTFRTPASRN